MNAPLPRPACDSNVGVSRDWEHRCINKDLVLLSQKVAAEGGFAGVADLIAWCFETSEVSRDDRLDSRE
jgi:hypothetical protein